MVQTHCPNTVRCRIPVSPTYHVKTSGICGKPALFRARRLKAALLYTAGPPRSGRGALCRAMPSRTTGWRQWRKPARGASADIPLSPRAEHRPSSGKLQHDSKNISSFPFSSADLNNKNELFQFSYLICECKWEDGIYADPVRWIHIDVNSC